LAALALMPFDDQLRVWMQGEGVQGSDFTGGTAKVFREFRGRVPRLGMGSLALVGWVTGRETLTDVSLHCFEAILLGRIVTGVLKALAGRRRPNGGTPGQWDFEFGRGILEDGNVRSFPSGHTTNAFALAASMAWEARLRWPRQSRVLVPALFATASLTGLSRMYHDEHWASDVVMGAAVGTLVGRTVVWLNHRSEDRAGPLSGPLVWMGPTGEPVVAFNIRF
jgi:membrane-associated phospholipid phosphatase